VHINYFFFVNCRAEDDISGSFILKGKSYSQTDNTGTSSIKAAKYSIALQYLVFDGLVNDQVE
jgi:hypothetical protein